MQEIKVDKTKEKKRTICKFYYKNHDLKIVYTAGAKPSVEIFSDGNLMDTVTDLKNRKITTLGAWTPFSTNSCNFRFPQV